MVVNSQSILQIREAWLGDIGDSLQHSLFGKLSWLTDIHDEGTASFIKLGCDWAHSRRPLSGPLLASSQITLTRTEIIKFVFLRFTKMLMLTATRIIHRQIIYQNNLHAKSF